MKSLKTGVLVLLFTFTTLSQAQTSAPTLKQNMDTIKSLVTSITANANDATKNTASSALATQLIAVFTATLSQVPTSITSMAAAQQSTAVAQYQGLIQKEIDDATALKAAFDSNNNTQAATILQDMNTIKSQGHSAFN